MESSGSTFDIGFYFQTILNNLREFFYQKIAEMEAFQDAQAAEIEALTTKLIVLGILAIALVFIILIIVIALKVGKGRKRREEIEAAEERLRREERRLKRERQYYEAQNRAMQHGHPQQEFCSQENLNYPHSCSNHGWRQPQIVPERESKEVRDRASRTTQYIGNVSREKDDFDWL